MESPLSPDIRCYHASIRLDGREHQYSASLSRNTRDTRIKCSPDGIIIVQAPAGTSKEEIERRIYRVLEKNQEFSGTQNQADDKSPTHGETGVKTYQMEYKGQCVQYQIKRTKRARRLTIKIYRNKEVQVVCPPRTKMADISAFMSQKAEWVLKHTLYSDHIPPPRREYRDGEVWPYFGRTIPIRIIRGENTGLFESDGYLCILVPAECSGIREQECIKLSMRSFYSQNLHAFAFPLFEMYAKKLGINVPPVKIRDQKTKWGACTSQSITLNLRLCMASPDIIEYVIVHEISHKVNPDHSVRFWNTVEQLLPDYRQRREKLKKYGHLWVL